MRMKPKGGLRAIVPLKPGVECVSPVPKLVLVSGRASASVESKGKLRAMDPLKPKGLLRAIDRVEPSKVLRLPAKAFGGFFPQVVKT